MRSVFIVLLAFAASSALAADLRVDKKKLKVGETLEIMITLEGNYAAGDSFALPLENLEIDGPPSVSSQWQWVGGVSSRQKFLRYTARAQAPGRARVGPVIVRDDGGNQLNLGTLAIEVLPDEPVAISTGSLEQMISAAKGLVLVPEVSRARVFAGEQLIVTWFLYSTHMVRQFQVTRNPVMTDFWVEEIPLREEASALLSMDGEELHKVPVRRVALFPSRAGALELGRMESVVEVLQPSRRVFSPFRIFEGHSVELRRHSRPLVIEVLPLPPVSPSRVPVGTFSIQCRGPRTGSGGLVSFDVTVEGTGNLRSTETPRWASPLAGTVTVEERELKVTRNPGQVRMSRSWRFLIFPSRGGSFKLPTLELDYFDPEKQAAGTLACTSPPVQVRGPGTNGSEGPSDGDDVHKAPQAAGFRPGVEGVKIAAMAAAAGLLLFILIRRRKRSAPSLDAELQSKLGVPGDLRQMVFARVAASGYPADQLFSRRDELGESFRAFASLIDLMEKQPWEIEISRGDLVSRLGELFKQLKRVRG